MKVIKVDYEVFVRNFNQAKVNLETYMAKAVENGLVDEDFKRPKLNFNLRGQTGGKAYYRQHEIRLNKELLGIEANTQQMVENTLAHELAHLIVGASYPRAKPHGIEFQRVMRRLGEVPTTTHSMDIAPKSGEVPYKCNCVDEHMLSPIRHKKVLRGASYRCGICKTKLVEVG